MFAESVHRPYYYSFLKRYHKYFRPSTYVEIGVQHGYSLAHAGGNTFCIGIDPEPRIRCALPPSTRIYRLSSDDFFARYDVRQELDGRDVELAFIDGMHLFEFALRDFINLEKHCNQQSIILIHDVSPIDRLTSMRTRFGRVWTGDIWKIVLCLKQYRDDLNILTADVRPSGLGIIYGLNPENRILEIRYDEIIREYATLDVNIVLANPPTVVNFVSSDNAWSALEKLHFG